MKHAIALLLVVMTTACAAKVGAQSKTIPSDAATTCQSQCQQMGLHMTAVAIMAETIGCVCQVRPSVQAENSGASTAGMVTIMHQEAQAQAEQRAAAAQQQK